MQRIEFKSQITADDVGMIMGIAWPFNAGPDRVGDEITKGAFASAKTPLPLLFSHDPEQPVGVWDSIAETDDGLVVKGKLLIGHVARAKEIHALVKAGALSGLSIGFVTRKAAPRRGGGRTISNLELMEISLVSIPAHPRARITGAKDATAANAIAEAINRAAVALRTQGK
jgi:HK97 family phage prohead protease